MAIDWETVTEAALHEQNDRESHIETDPWTWHPSQLAKCKRQAYVSKLGLEAPDAESLGKMKVGTLIHQWFEETVEPDGTTMYEVPLSYERDGVTITGRTDCLHFGENHDWSYDFKTRGGWYNFEQDDERDVKDWHLDQLWLYMAGVDADFGQVVYVSRKDMTVKPRPPGGIRYLDAEVDRIIETAREMSQLIEDEGLPTQPSDIPFDHCGCWICDNETLDPEAFY